MFAIGGVMISPIVPSVLAALLATMLLSKVLVVAGFYRLVWRRPVVELAIFCILLGLIVVLMPHGPRAA